jgi:hypothetical protein
MAVTLLAMHLLAWFDGNTPAGMVIMPAGVSPSV